MQDRKTPPPLKVVDSLEFIHPHIYDISPDVKLYFMKEVPNETARFDLYFDAGNTKMDRGIPSFVNGMLFSGTPNKTTTQIHEEIDHLGGYLETNISAENAVITMYSLRENLLPLIHLVKDSIENVSFPEEEYVQMLNDRKQNFKVNLEKVNVLAQRALQQRLFHSHPDYARITQEEWFEPGSIKELKHFHNKHYLQGLSKVVVVGNMLQDDIDEIIDAVGSWVHEGKSEFPSDIKNLADKIHIEKEGALQTAIRVGKMLFDKKHPDYHDFQILHTLLGDYFGSRLMTNIREEKGYTYGIGSMVAEFSQTGYFMIATEVGKEVKDATLSEIKKEFERLQNELVSKEELQLVGNYMLGQLLKSADGPYSMMDLFLSAEGHGLDYEFYNEAIRSIQNITPERIQELAKKYLNWEDFTIVSAG